MSKSNIEIIQTPTLEWYVVRCEFRNGHQEKIGQRDWTTCSKYAIYSRLNSQLDWEDLSDHLMSRRIFSFIMSKIFI